MGSGNLSILLVGALIVFLDGQLIFRRSPSYLDEVYRDSGRARQLSGLVAVLFHLVMLGAVALLASIGLNPDTGPRAESLDAELDGVGRSDTFSDLLGQPDGDLELIDYRQSLQPCWPGCRIANATSS